MKSEQIENLKQRNLFTGPIQKPILEKTLGYE